MKGKTEMKRFAESIRYMCSDEDGKFRLSELVGGILFAYLTSLKYEREGAYELVVATFSNGYQKTANVTADSGTAMIVDIIAQCQ